MSQSPISTHSRKAMMGGAADGTQRSSSPLKRRASDLEETDVVSTQKEDVEMVTAPPSEEVQDEKSLTNLTQTLPAEAAGDGSAEEEKSTAQTSQPRTDIPPIDHQIKTVSTLATAALEGQPQEGDESFLVSMLWLKRVTDRGTEARQNSKVEPEGEIGPVDNSDIIQQVITDAEGVQFAQLKVGMNRPEHFEMFPKDAWDMIVEWYGIMSGTVPIVRYAHNTNPDKHGLPNMQYELNPPIFTIHRLWGEQNPILLPQKLKAENPKAPVLILSTSTKYVEFLEQIKAKTSIEKSKKVRIWRVPRQQPAANTSAPIPNAATPPSSRPNSPNQENTTSVQQPQDSWTQLLLDLPSLTELEKGSQRELVDQQDVSANANYNGNMTLSIVGLAESQTIVIDEEVDAKTHSFVSNFSVNFFGGKHPKSAALSPIGTSQSAPVSRGNSPAPGMMTRGRTKNGRTLGTVGLSNLGNTCYMNSALQCVRSVEELSKYFLTGAATEELNCDNPLGNNGEVAIAYARLLQEFYKDPVPTSTAPRNFKNTIGKYAPSFSGYGQQDSQEFLGFLLDGLQEDLSRVKKKPYIEKPDSTDEMINNPQAIREMAEKVWDITKKRDDSVIADLFTGMYQSTLVCPHCSKVSITFDPFNTLTMQLPIENSWHHMVYYFPLNDTPVIIQVDMDKQGSIFNMKEFISKRVGVPVNRLFAAEEFKSKFYKIHDDTLVASDEITGNDICAVYELEAKPTNWPPVKKAKKQKSVLNYGSTDMEDVIPHWSDPMADSMLVPVFHRRPNPERTSRFKKQWIVIPAPHFIVVSRTEARDIEMIKRKVLEKVATFSTSNEFSTEEDEADASVSDGVDPDIVLTTGSDADSSGGSKVVATSIDGEDELVDVTMKDSNVTSAAAEKADDEKSQSVDQESVPLKDFNKQRPKFMTPGSYLNPSLQNMFQLNYFSTPNVMIPSGWNVVDDDKAYPPLDNRIPQSQQPSVDGSDGSSTRARSESSNEGDSVALSNQPTRMNEESSADELSGPGPTISKALPVRSRAGVRVGGSKRRNRKMKTYSKKGNQRRAFTDGANEIDEETVDEGPLIRLGEGIVVDWNADAWEAIYDGNGQDMRGCDTISNIPTLADPELEAKKKARLQRRKNGITLDDCLNEFGKEEILSENDTWYCPRCKEHRRASKKFDLWKTPDILVIHLKRFSSSGVRRDKLDVMVDFPIEGLDLSSRVFEKEDGKQEIYDLIAVDDHWGGLGGGHYTAFAKSFIDGEWYEYNDSSVSKIKDAHAVVTQAAYLLFYRRRSEVPLGGERFQKIFEDFENPQAADDDAMESGEGQRLVGNTFRGSSSALTGVEAAHRQPNHGSANAGMMSISSAIESLPPYQTHEDNDVNDAIMMDDNPIQSSIEEDEGIEMGDDGMNFSNVDDYNQLDPVGLDDLIQPHPWSFGSLGAARGENIVSGTGSDEMDDGRSDRGQFNSSASSGSRADRLAEFESASLEESYIDHSPVPDMDEQQQLGVLGLHEDLLANQRPEFNVHPSLNGEDIEEPATEIHVEEGEELKID